MAPVDTLRSLKSYFGKQPEPLPAFSTRTVALISIGYTLLYVAPLYLTAATRPSPTLTRDAPSAIRARIRLVLSSTTAITAATFVLLSRYAHVAPRSLALHQLGLWPVGVAEVLRVLVLVATLFAGPLFERGVVLGRWRRWVSGRGLREGLGSWVGVRNYVVGPLTEELLFRASLLPLALHTAHTPRAAILLTPLYFGIAHLHHLLDFRLTYPRHALGPAVFRSLFQFAYTTLFGWFAAFAFVRTGSVAACVAAHVFCNWMGLPRVWGRLGRRGEMDGDDDDGDDDGAGNGDRYAGKGQGHEPLGGAAGDVTVGPPGINAVDGASKRSESEPKRKHHRHQSRRGTGTGTGAGSGRGRADGGDLGLAWTVAYYVLLVAGAVGFYRGLWPLTESGMALAKV